MNPSDDEEEKDVRSQDEEEIEELLEPQAIPDERIVRHAERNDSYREAPTLTNDEEIIQLPLDPPEEETIPDVHPVAQTHVVIEEEQEEVVESPLSESAPLITEVEMMSQEIPHISEVENIIPEVQDQEDKIAEPVPVPLETITSPEPQPQAPLPLSDQPHTEYHTVSGGPETIHDIMSHQLQATQAEHPPTDTTYPTIMSVSGYTIPNPNYVTPVHQDLKPASNLGFTFFLILMALIGGAFAYVYFFMPQTFDEVFAAVTIVFDELLKNVK